MTLPLEQRPPAIRLSLSRLEEARRNPERFAANMARAGGMKMSRTRALQLATYYFHRQDQDPDAALRYLVDLYSRNFKTPENLPKLEEHLQDYIADYKRRGTTTYQVQGRLAIPVTSDPDVLFTGELGRADLGGGHYAVWLFGMKRFDWASELRMPLIQAAVAQRHGVGPDLVSVGWYFFEPGEYDAETFNSQQIESAREEAEKIARIVGGAAA
jgi:hypothetical protein